MGKFWKAIKAAVGERIREEYEREIEPLRRPIRTLKEKVEREIRDTGTFGEHLLGQAPMYNPRILYHGSRRDYVDERGKALADYDFNFPLPLPNGSNYRITKFPISVYVPKGQEEKLPNLIAAEIKRLTDRGKILDFESLANDGLVEALAYEVTGGEARPARRNVFRIFGDDMRKSFYMKPAKQREPKAVGATYTILITPMIPKDGPGYAPGVGYTPSGGNGGPAPGNGTTI